MPTLLAIHGSATRPGRLYHALEHALGIVETRSDGVIPQILNLGDHRISFADGRSLSSFEDDTEMVVEQVINADMFLIATPIFRASFTASLKNLLDLVPIEGLMGKVCGLVAMGATDHHYLAIDSQLRPVLAWFGTHVVPGPVYLQSSHFQDGKLADEKAIGQLHALVTSVIAMHQAVADQPGSAGPPPLAAT